MDANIYNSWLECYNNISFLSNYSNVKEIHIPIELFSIEPEDKRNCPSGIAQAELPKRNCLSGIAQAELPKRNCKMKKSYFIEDVSNITIHIDDKINHLILNRCNNINLIINVDLISGLDIFHSSNVNITYARTTTSIVNSINFGRNYHICIVNPYTINCMMCTICVNNMYFIINDTAYKVYENLFRANPLYFFIEKADADADADADGSVTINTIDSMYGLVCSKTF
jgi:hypothetical protein